MRPSRSQTPLPQRSPLISSVRVVLGPAHDVVTAWNRGACAGTLTVTSGEGVHVAARLAGLPEVPKCFNARESMFEIEGRRQYDTHMAVCERAFRNVVATLDGDGGQKQEGESVEVTLTRIVHEAVRAVHALRYVRERVELSAAMFDRDDPPKHGPGCERMSDGGDANDERADTCGADCDFTTMASMSNRLDAIDDEMRALVKANA